MSPLAAPDAWSRLEADFGLMVGGGQRRLTERYLELLLKWSGAVNVAGRDSAEDFLRFDFFESFWVADLFLGEAGRLVDVGSGAGFPGLAAKLRRPETAVVLIEANFKKVVFLREAARELKLGVDVFHGRAEDFRGWECGDLATVRALRPSAALLRRLTEVQARLLCLHGARAPGELAGAAPRSRRLVPGSRERFVSLYDWGGGSG